MNLFIRSHVEEDPSDEHFEGDSGKMYKKYLSHLNDVQQELVANNPKGWQDDFEQRINHYATEAGRRHGTHVMVTEEDNKHTINVYSPRAARSMGLMDMRQRTPKEEQLQKLQRKQFHEELDKVAMGNLKRSAERMHAAGMLNDLFGDGSYTLDPDAENPGDIYRPA